MVCPYHTLLHISPSNIFYPNNPSPVFGLICLLALWWMKNSVRIPNTALVGHQVTSQHWFPASGLLMQIHAGSTCTQRNTPKDQERSEQIACLSDSNCVCLSHTNTIQARWEFFSSCYLRSQLTGECSSQGCYHVTAVINTVSLDVDLIFCSLLHLCTFSSGW